jgi:hypothetical protein
MNKCQSGILPVPIHKNGRLTVLEDKVPSRKLLVSKERTIATTNESKVAHETTRTIVHKDTLM